MDEHLKNLRHKIKGVPNIKTFEDLLLNLKVSDEDKDILRAIYINNKMKQLFYSYINSGKVYY